MMPGLGRLDNQDNCQKGENMAHQEICLRCDGTGKVTCSNCKGKGKVGSRYWTLTGTTNCPKCGGDGYEDCSTCRGTGVVTLPDD